MAPFWTDDIPTLFADFGETITRTTDDTVEEFTGIFNASFVAEQFQLAGIEHSGPSVTARSSDVATIAHGDTLTRESTDYKVIGIQNDGTGITVLLLSED